MKRKKISGILLLTISFLLLLFFASCKKRTPVVPPTSSASKTTVMPPTIDFNASPAIIDYGKTTTLSWTTTNANEVILENVGKFPPNGSTVVRPEKSSTYTAIANGPGGMKSATVRVTVIGEKPSAAVSEKPAVEEHPLTTEDIFKAQIRDVFFDFDKYDLTPEAKATLRKDAEILINEIPNAKILIEGHCDERGTEEYNLALGDKRANAARDFLTSLGVSASRIRTISYGEERPFDPRHNEEAWAKNRRAHFVLIK